jgi:hypothetical protein
VRRDLINLVSICAMRSRNDVVRPGDETTEIFNHAMSFPGPEPEPVPVPGFSNILG